MAPPRVLLLEFHTPYQGVRETDTRLQGGHKQKAISALREAINAGWRYSWWQLNSPHYDAMRAEPEWIELMTELEADIAREREWYENHKDDPLF